MKYKHRIITALSLILTGTVLYSGVKVSLKEVWAKTVATSVTVGNSAPSFTAGPAENPASDNTTPTNVGAAVTFQATGTDNNNENYYLAICKTNSVTAVNGGAPTCGGGNWCISSSTASGAQASCNFTVTTSETLESYDWYAFICDGNSSSASCSTAQQGSGSSGSPFAVNHSPGFSSITGPTAQNPGGTATWTATSSDTDTAGVADTVKLLVCKTTGISAGDCDGGASDRWCQSTASASNPSCSYSVPTPYADQTYNAYVYIVDSHNLASAGAAQGSASNMVVNNVAPTIVSQTINGGSDITVQEYPATQAVASTAQISDNNGCSDVTSVTVSLYRSSIGYSACDAGGETNSNSCYAVTTCSTSNCSTGATADYTCSTTFTHYADPTDTNTPYSADTWKQTVKVTDNNAATASPEIGTGVELNSRAALDFDETGIDYGNLDAGQSNDPLSPTVNIKATGNTGIDPDVSGTDMDDGASHTIPVANQKYNTTASAYASAIALSTTPTSFALHVQKTTSGTLASKLSYWGLFVPLNTVPGSYSGTNTITAAKSPAVNW